MTAGWWRTPRRAGASPRTAASQVHPAPTARGRRGAACAVRSSRFAATHQPCGHRHHRAERRPDRTNTHPGGFHEGLSSIAYPSSGPKSPPWLRPRSRAAPSQSQQVATPWVLDLHHDGQPFLPAAPAKPLGTPARTMRWNGQLPCRCSPPTIQGDRTCVPGCAIAGRRLPPKGLLAPVTGSGLAADTPRRAVFQFGEQSGDRKLLGFRLHLDR